MLLLKNNTKNTNLKILNFEMLIFWFLKFWNFEFYNFEFLKFWCLKFWIFKFWILKFWNLKVLIFWILKFWNFENLKSWILNFEIITFLSLVVLLTFINVMTRYAGNYSKPFYWQPVFLGDFSFLTSAWLIILRSLTLLLAISAKGTTILVVSPKDALGVWCFFLSC